jgi:hypothetical protein
MTSFIVSTTPEEDPGMRSEKDRSQRLRGALAKRLGGVREYSGG